MIYIAAALYAEAKPLIECFNLKKDTSYNKIQLFSSCGVCLVLTGSGILSSAVALSRLFGTLPPSKGDIFANIGVCGGNFSGTFICNKITSSVSNRSVYTDMLYAAPFQEAEIISYLSPQQNIPKGTLADTEAYGIAKAAESCFSAERMFFIKVVSDNGSFSTVTSDYVTSLIAKAAPKIKDFLLSVPPMPASFNFSQKEKTLMAEFKLTVTQTHIFEELLKYHSLNGGSIQNLLSACPKPTTKNQGRDLLEYLRKTILK